MVPGDPVEDDAFRRIANEKKNADRAVSIGLEKVWPWVVFFGGPAVNGLIAPAIAEQTTFFGVFLATLAFSSGVAAFSFIVVAKVLGEMGGIQYAIVATVCLLIGSFLAVSIGVGFYEVPVPYGKYGGTPYGGVMPYLEAAVKTFGPLGAVLGALSGFIAGRWGAMAYKEIG